MTKSIAVLDKAFGLLEAMSDLGRSASLGELAEVTALPKPTLHHILQTLMDLGYVDQDFLRGRYRLTMRLLHLGRSDSFESLKEQVLPTMERLHRRFDETVNLGILQGSHVYYAHFIETTQKLRWQVRPGARDPFYCTALGRAIVAHLPEPRQSELLERMQIEERTPFTPETRDEVQVLLARAAADGVAIDDQENDLGVVCFGVPVMQDGAPIASISVSVPKSRLTQPLREAIVANLRGAETDIGALEMPRRSAGVR